MSKIEDGGPAFPVVVQLSDNHLVQREEGMTLRDYMAIHASADDVRAQGEVIRMSQAAAGGLGILPDGWGITARYMHADAMLKEREQS